MHIYHLDFNEQFLESVSPSHLEVGIMNRKCFKEFCYSLTVEHAILHSYEPWNPLGIPCSGNLEWTNALHSKRSQKVPLLSLLLESVAGTCLKSSQSDSLSQNCKSEVNDAGSHRRQKAIFSVAADQLCLLPTSGAPQCPLMFSLWASSLLLVLWVR